MTRHVTAGATLLSLVALLAFDHATVELNPYKAPPLLALGSGIEASGGFCGALPD